MPRPQRRKATEKPRFFVRVVDANGREARQAWKIVANIPPEIGFGTSTASRKSLSLSLHKLTPPWIWFSAPDRELITGPVHSFQSGDRKTMHFEMSLVGHEQEKERKSRSLFIPFFLLGETNWKSCSPIFWRKYGNKKDLDFRWVAFSFQLILFIAFQHSYHFVYSRIRIL